jgi:Tfp pilus assembly protein PilV
MRKSNNKENGLTLVGAMIAMLILAVGIVGIIQLHAVVIRNKAIAAQHSEALVLAENKMVEFRKFSKITTSAGFTAYSDIVSGSSSVTRNSVTYSLVWTVTDVLSPPHKVISISVSWTDSTNTLRTVSLSSHVSPIDPVTGAKYLEGL